MADKREYIISKLLSIKQALKVMDDLLASTLFIEDADKLIGSVSAGDIRRALLQEVNLNTAVSEIMHSDPICARENPDSVFVKSMFLDRKISAIPVVDDNRKVIEIIFRTDVFEGRHEAYSKINLPVVIMAGGRGARMDPFTRVLPKALIPIDEKPVINVIMEEYSKYGMSNFIVSLNHKSKMIKAYFQEHKSDYNVDFIQEDSAFGTAGSLRLLNNKIYSSFFVSNCDIIVKTDYTDIYNFHTKKNFALTLVASMQHHVVPYGVCELDKGGVLKAIKEKPEYDLLINTGMYILSPEVLGFIPENTVFHMTDLINKLKQANHEIGIYPVSERSWVDIGQWGKYRESVDRLNAFLKEAE